MPENQKSKVAIRCSGVKKSYGSGSAQVIALRGVDLEVQEGELCMIVGPSGCGKTTLLSIITGILDQDEGQCEVFGHDLKHMDAGEKTRFRGQTVGYVFQVFNLLPALTAMENVAIPLLLNGVSRKEAETRVHKVLDTVGLHERPTALPAQLSGGQQQRVAIARALIHRPRLIVCDEPTSNLDHKTGYAMMNMLRDVVRSPERALLIVTHDTRILNFADRLAQMDDGRIGAISSRKDLEGQS